MNAIYAYKTLAKLLKSKLNILRKWCYHLANKTNKKTMTFMQSNPCIKITTNESILII